MRGELKVLKPHITGRCVAHNKILWRCSIRQMIGEMPFMLARSQEHYTPGKAYKVAMRRLARPFAEALIGA